MSSTSVLYVHTRFESPGGANYIAVETANRLVSGSDLSVAIATARFNTDVYTLESDVNLYEFGGGSPGTLSHWIQLPRVLSRLISVIQKTEADVVVFHSVPTPYWTVLLRRFTSDVAYIWYAHDPNSYLNLPGKIKDVPLPIRSVVRVGFPVVRRFDRYTIGTCLDCVIANSEFTKEIIQDTYGIHPTVVYPGIDVDQFTHQSVPTERFLFTVGQLNQYKNFDVLIRAMSRLDQQLAEPPRLLIGGTGPHRAELEDFVELHGVDELVKFVGLLSDAEVAKFYSKAIATIYLPENEPFGLVPIEAMAAGTPVVGVDSGGIRETVADGETGLLVPECSETNIAQAITELITDPERCKDMGIEASQRMVSRFSIENMVEGLVDVFERYD